MAEFLRDRTIFGPVSVTLALVLTYFIFSFEDPYSSIVTLNIAIFLAWMAFGIFGGSAMSLFAVVITLLFELRSGISGYPLLTVLFLVSTIAGYICNGKLNDLRSDLSLKLEKSEEVLISSENSISEKENDFRSFTEKLKRYSRLKETVEALSASLSLDEVSRLITEKVRTTVNKPGRVLLFIVDTEKQELMLFASHGSSRVKAKRGDMFDHWVLRHRKSLIIEDVCKDFRFPPHEEEPSGEVFRSVISAPLVSENKVIGVLRMDSPEGFAYTQDDLRILDILSDLGALALQNAHLYSKTQELAIKDSLTGLAVRRYFTDRLKEEVKRSARKGTKLSVLMIDIDRFKDYNDLYGHLSGDLVLKHLSGILSSSMKEGDVVARYGGEEFVFLMCGRGKAQALAEAEKIRAAVKNAPLKLRRQDANITVSIGVSYYPEDTLLEEELIRMADDRLYKAKADGRDKVC